MKRLPLQIAILLFLSMFIISTPLTAQDGGGDGGGQYDEGGGGDDGGGDDGGGDGGGDDGGGGGDQGGGDGGDGGGSGAQLSISFETGAILCNGATTDVTIYATGGVAPYSGAGVYSQAAGSVTYTVTDANGMSASTTVTLEEPAALVASIASLPVSTLSTCAFGGSDANIIIGYGSGAQTANLNGSASGGTGAVSFAWSPASNLNSGSIANPVFTPSQGPAGCANYSYTLTVTDANGCISETETSVKVANVVAQYNPNGTVKKVKVCHHTSSSTNTEVDIEISPSAVATHLAHGDCLGDCEDNCDANGRHGQYIEHNDGFQGGSVDVAPNPNDGAFTLDITPAIPNTEVVMEIFDATGKLIYSQTYVDVTYMHLDIDLNQITGGSATGMYFINVVNGEYVFTRRVAVAQ